jgi:hypothetical protein
VHLLHRQTHRHTAVTLRYLPEDAENALLALDLARKEAAQLQYTQRTLFAQSVGLTKAQAKRRILELA